MTARATARGGRDDRATRGNFMDDSDGTAAEPGRRTACAADVDWQRATLRGREPGLTDMSTVVCGDGGGGTRGMTTAASAASYCCEDTARGTARRRTIRPCSAVAALPNPGWLGGDSIHVHYGDVPCARPSERTSAPGTIENVPRETWDYDVRSCDVVRASRPQRCDEQPSLRVPSNGAFSCDQGAAQCLRIRPTLCAGAGDAGSLVGRLLPRRRRRRRRRRRFGARHVRGLAAIGITFTGISIAAIANAVQEQCALGPTIVYEAGTTHPYYISPNLCSIGTKTYASKNDRARRLAAQGLPQVLRGRVRRREAGAQARAGPDVLLQTEVEPFCRRPIALPSPTDCRPGRSKAWY